MNSKGQAFAIGTLVVLAFTLIVGIVLLSQIGNQQNLLTTKQTTTNQTISATTLYEGANEVNETINLTIYTQSAWKQSECPISSVAIRTGDGTTLGTGNYTLYTAQGVFSLTNTTYTVPSATSNLTYADYTFCADGYNTDAASRGIAGLITVFGAIAVLVVAFLGIKYDWFKR